MDHKNLFYPNFQGEERDVINFGMNIGRIKKLKFSQLEKLKTQRKHNQKNQKHKKTQDIKIQLNKQFYIFRKQIKLKQVSIPNKFKQKHIFRKTSVCWKTIPECLRLRNDV